MKDLSKLGRDLKNCIIVDNLPVSFSGQPENGLPILSWYDNQNDVELDKLYLLLVMLSKVKDVRPYIKKIAVNNKIRYDKVEKILEKRADNPQLLKALRSLRQSQGESPNKPDARSPAVTKVEIKHKSKSKERLNVDDVDHASDKVTQIQIVKQNSNDTKSKSKSPKKSPTITLEENTICQTRKLQKGTIDILTKVIRSQPISNDESKSNKNSSKPNSNIKPRNKAISVSEKLKDINDRCKPKSVKVAQ